MCVCVYSHGFHSRRSCLARWTAPMSLRLYFRTLCCPKGQIKKHRNPHKAEGGGCRVKGVEGGYPQTTHTKTHTSQAQGQCWQRGGERETGEAKESSEKQGSCEEDSSFTEWKLSREDRRVHLRVLGHLFKKRQIWPLIQGINRQIWTSWTENNPARRHLHPQRQPVRLTPTTTTTRFVFSMCIIENYYANEFTFVQWEALWSVPGIGRMSICGRSRCCVWTAGTREAALHLLLHTETHSLCKVMLMCTHTHTQNTAWSFLFPLMSHRCEAWPGVGHDSDIFLDIQHIKSLLSKVRMVYGPFSRWDLKSLKDLVKKNPVLDIYCTYFGSD